MRKLLIGAAAAVLVLGGSTAIAVAQPAVDTDCSDYEYQVLSDHPDYSRDLDADGDGVGCESNPPNPTATTTVVESDEELTSVPSGPVDHP